MGSDERGTLGQFMSHVVCHECMFMFNAFILGFDVFLLKWCVDVWNGWREQLFLCKRSFPPACFALFSSSCLGLLWFLLPRLCMFLASRGANIPKNPWCCACNAFSKLFFVSCAAWRPSWGCLPSPSGRFPYRIGLFSTVFWGVSQTTWQDLALLRHALDPVVSQQGRRLECSSAMGAETSKARNLRGEPIGRPSYGRNLGEPDANSYLCNDLQVAIDLNVGQGWCALYPADSLGFEASAGETLAVRLRDDHDIHGQWQLVDSVTQANVSAAFGPFCKEATRWHEEEQRSARRERELLFEREQVWRDMYTSMYEKAKFKAVWRLVAFVLVPTSLLTVCAFVEPEVKWASVLLGLAAAVFFGTCCVCSVWSGYQCYKFYFAKAEEWFLTDRSSQKSRGLFACIGDLCDCFFAYLDAFLWNNCCAWLFSFFSC